MKAGEPAPKEEAQPGQGEETQGSMETLERFMEEWARVLGKGCPLLSKESLEDLKALAPPPGIPFREEPVGLEAIYEEIRACRACRLGQVRRKPVPGEGPLEPPFMFIGEGPEAMEDQQGKPFVGPAGELLTAMIEKGIGIPRSRVYITNVVKCRPPGNRDPEADEVEACWGFLVRQIQIVRPRVLICLGRVAASALLRTRLPLNVLRGKPRRFQGIPLVVTWHPSYLLRNPAAKRGAWEDLKKAMALAGLPPGKG